MCQRSKCKPKTVKLLEENIRKKKLPDTGIGKDFFDMTAKTQATKVKIDKLNCTKI